MNTCLILGLASAMSIQVASGDMITVNSDARVTFLDGTFTSADFSPPFTAANIAAATPAVMPTGTPSPLAPSAHWVGAISTADTNAGGTAVPEPSGTLLLGTGLIVAGALWWLRARHDAREARFPHRRTRTRVAS